jgi:hypothetical protein
MGGRPQRSNNVEDGIQAVPRGHLFSVLDLDVMMNMYYVVVAIFTFGGRRPRAGNAAGAERSG